MALIRRCVLCGRTGTHNFVPAVTQGEWRCQSGAACERRIRGTGQTGVGTMRNYVR
jgi:hypothetical protein